MSTAHQDAFKTALNNACGEINEAARLPPKSSQPMNSRWFGANSPG